MTDKNIFHSPKGEADHLKYHTKAERRIDALLPDFEDFVSNLAVAGTLLALATAIALLLATFYPFSYFYQLLVSYEFGLILGKKWFVADLKFWVNELLLSIFFFFIGLEIKREALAGQLANRKNVLTIMIAAMFGMLFPAFIYSVCCYDSELLKGWGIPVATDTAFALGIIFLFRHQFTKAGIIYITSIAIIDDIGAILIIAFFYTENLDLIALAYSGGLVALMILINFFGVRKMFPYVILGSILWICLHHSGIHATITGILMAFVTPSRPQKGPREMIRETKYLLNKLEKHNSAHILEEPGPQKVITDIVNLAYKSSSPLIVLGDKLHFPIFFIILPTFAFFNAGLKVETKLLAVLLESPIALGIMLGLVFGKPIGICLGTYVTQKLKIGNLPDELKWDEIFNLSLFAAIGFTMSLFISNLSFVEQNNIDIAKAAIILASIFASIAGISVVILRKIGFIR